MPIMVYVLPKQIDPLTHLTVTLGPIFARMILSFALIQLILFTGFLRVSARDVLLQRIVRYRNLI